MKIPRIILGSATFTSEGYFGHRTRLYDLDLHKNPQNVAKIIKKSCEIGINGINLVNDEKLIEAFKIATSKDVFMGIIGTIGKTKIDYINPNYEKSKQVDWERDIVKLKELGCKIMLVDEFITDSYDFELLEKILVSIKNHDALPGLITAYPFNTTEILINSPIKELFDFYMIPINKLGYMMDTESFMDNERKKLAILLKKIDKEIIANKILAAGIQHPLEAFNFLKKFNQTFPKSSISIVTVGIANENEAKETFKIIKEI